MKHLPKHISGVRKLVAQSKGEKIWALKNFEEAKKHKDAYLIMEGDYGGQIYLSIPVRLVKCSKIIMDKLLQIIDEIQWNDEDGAGIYFERLKIGENITGGMDGGKALNSIWVHENLENFKDVFFAILKGKKDIERVKLKQ